LKHQTSLVSITNELTRIKKNNDIDKQKFLMFSIYSELLLSTSIFPHNSDLKEYIPNILNQMNSLSQDDKSSKDITFGDYVYKSRTILVSRMIRLIEHSSQEQLKILLKNVEKKIVSSSPKKENKVNKNKKHVNKVDELLNQFGR
jgi:hypothetical protein